MGLGEIILLIALAVALATWGIAQAVIALTYGEKQRLQQRLIRDWHDDGGAPSTRSLMMRPELQGMPAILAGNPFIQELNRKLIGAYPEAKLVSFLVLVGLTGAVGIAVMGVLMGSVPGGLAAGLGGLYLPIVVVNRKRARRQKMLAEQLPEALEFLTRVLKAGHSLSTGIQMMGDELPEPIVGEFRRCYDQHSLGQSLEESLREMAGRIDSSDFAFFVTAVLIQRQTGGDLSEVLSNIAGMVRSRIRLQQHVKAITAEGRLTGYILFAFPIALFAILYLMNPEYAGVLLTTDAGRMLLVAAGGMQAIGFFVMRRIVAVQA